MYVAAMKNDRRRTRGFSSNSNEEDDTCAGHRRSRLVVESVVQRRSLAGESEWFVLCLCDCGSRKEVRRDAFLSGAVKSCGCLRRERMATLNRSHGLHGTPIHRTWRGIKDRVNDPSKKSYGGRGITMFAPWARDLSAFASYVESTLGPKPSRKHSIDRIDNDLGYKPGNIRWATPQEQARNRRDNVLITANGETKCVTEWANILGTSPQAIHIRLKRGWSPEKAVTAPPRRYAGNELVTANGETRTTSEWADLLGRTPREIQARIKKGWSPQKAVTTPFRKYTKKT